MQEAVGPEHWQLWDSESQSGGPSKRVPAEERRVRVCYTHTANWQELNGSLQLLILPLVPKH